MEPRSYQHYLQFFSLRPQNQIQNLSFTQQKQKIIKIKSKAALFLIQAVECIKNNNFQKAKYLYMYVADSCLTVSNPDSQIQKWIQISCDSIGQIHNLQKKKMNSIGQKKRTILSIKRDEIVLCYNKLKGKFQIEAQQNFSGSQNIQQQVLQNISKINSILFTKANISTNHSLVVIMSMYWIQFLIIFALLFLFFFFLFDFDLFDLTKFQQTLWFYIPEIVLCICSIISLLFVYSRSYEEKSQQLVERKLRQCIERINDKLKLNDKIYEYILMENGQRIKIERKYDPKKDKANELNVYENQTPSQLIQREGKQGKKIFHFN